MAFAKKPLKKNGSAQRQRGAQRKKVKIASSRNWAWLKPLLKVSTLLGLAGVLFFAGKQLMPSLHVEVDRVVFSGDIHHASRSDLVSRVNPLLVTGYFGLDLQAIKRAVEAEPWVLSAKVERAWPKSLAIQVEEQTPIAYWGKDGLINFRGEVFIPKTVPKDLALPTLDGPDAASVGVMQAYQLISQMLVDTGIRLDSFSLDATGQWIAISEGGVEIRLGSKNPVKNMGRFLTVYNSKLRDRFADVRQVDTRYVNGVAVGWRNAQS